MAKEFCQQCGSGTEYNVNKPSFCSNCGVKFSNASLVSAEKPKIKKPKHEVEPDEDEEDEDESSAEIIDVPKLKFEVLADMRGTTSLKTLAYDKTKPSQIDRPKIKSKTFQTSKKF